ncbi:serine hydrolase domain-containing protein [Flavobacterium luteum]|uniref:Beta-lactamase family protein n=1 Tax=Flavobacterium luteum TaxID=2026654 RepID=A0A7J5ALC9_9FLAO|nr:serine hydrolase domain-containing protein [Flavobacterium luteum]KAB1157789.1 beta-lactamase family protein [Flavobacterium luteum]
MKKKIILLLVLFGIVFTTQSQEKNQKIDSLLISYSKIYRFNGTALVYRKGKVILEKGYGYQDINNNVPNTSSTIFQVGSITKQFTATVILKLVEDNKLTLQDRLTKYFPDYPRGNEITIAHLLSHTSGIYEYFRNPEYHITKSEKPLTKEERIALFKDKAMDFNPGTAFSYCNSGYELLGLIIEKITHKPYEQVVREMILKPLKMKNSGFDFIGLKSNLKAKPYTMYSKNKIIESIPWDSTATYSAGSMYSNAKDLYLWNEGLLKNKIIKKSTLENAYTPVLNDYGYAWWIETLYDKRVVSHGGNVDGFTSHFIRVPEDDICIVLLNNTYNHEIETIGNFILAILYNKPYKELNEIKIPNEDLKKYVGKYEVNSEYSILISCNNNQLVAQINGEPKFEIFAQNLESFFSKEEDLRMKFKSDNSTTYNKISIFRGLNTKRGVKVE